MKKTRVRLSDLEKMSDEELRALANHTLKLKEANKARRVEYYYKNMHEGQVRMHKSTKRIRYIFAGNRQGKTSSGMIEFRALNMGDHPFKKCKVPIKSAIVLQDFENHCKNILEPKIKEWIDPKEIVGMERHQLGALKRIKWRSGSITDVYSHDQSLKVFEGSDYDLVWFDEPPPRKIWVAMWRACTDRGGSMYLTGTPLTSPWLYHEAMRIKDGNDPIAEMITYAAYSNASNIGDGDKELGMKRLEELASQYSNEERVARIEGGFVQLQGLIFKDWNQRHHLIKPFPIPHNWPIYESIDPHPHKPAAVAWIAVAPNGSKILIRAMYFEGVLDEIANQIILARQTLLDVKDGMKPYIVKTVIDNASSVPLWQRSNTDPTSRRVSVKQELENMIGPSSGGPRVEVAPKNVAGKIDLFKRWLHVKEREGRERPEFFVFDNEDAENFVKEIEGYVWDRKRSSDGDELKTRPVKKNDDLLDAVMQIALILGESQGHSNEVVEWASGFETYGVRGRRFK